MSNPLNTKLDKVLALVDSSHEGEALVAVRKARQMLSEDGLSFGDLARAAVQKPRVNLPFGFFSGPHIISLETEILQMRQEIEDLRNEKIGHEFQADLWRQRAAELEQKLNISQAEAERWRQLARDTVEKLWDMGQSIEENGALLYPPDSAKTA